MEKDEEIGLCKFEGFDCMGETEFMLFNEFGVEMCENCLDQWETERKKRVGSTNWSEEDIGKQITVRFEHGTEIKDTIIGIPMEMTLIKKDKKGNDYPEIIGDGQMIIGPSIEVGMIHARLTHSLPLVHMLEAQNKAMQDAINNLSEEKEEEE